jgi:hypothetical protein
MALETANHCADVCSYCAGAVYTLMEALQVLAATVLPGRNLQQCVCVCVCVCVCANCTFLCPTEVGLLHIYKIFGGSGKFFFKIIV